MKKMMMPLGSAGILSFNLDLAAVRGIEPKTVLLFAILFALLIKFLSIVL